MHDTITGIPSSASAPLRLAKPDGTGAIGVMAVAGPPIDDLGLPGERLVLVIHLDTPGGVAVEVVGRP